MFKGFKKAFILSLVLLSSAFTTTTFGMELFYDDELYIYRERPITLKVEGTEIQNLQIPPVILNDNTFVPAKEVFELLGANVLWNDVYKRLSIVQGDKIITINADDKIALVNGEQKEMEVAAKLVNGKVMIPLEFVSEVAGFKVDWNNESREINITKIIDEFPNLLLPPNLSLPEIQLPKSGLAKDVSIRQIETQNHVETNIIGVLTPDNSQNGNFTIKASSAISRVEKTLLEDNRLIIDIYNSEMKIEKGTIIPTSPTVSEVRTSQFQTSPNKVSRIVFDLADSLEYSVEISQDRKEIYLIFEKNVITSVTFNTDGTSDYINITFKNEPLVKQHMTTNPIKIVIDAPISVLQSQFNQDVKGELVTGVHAVQTDSNNSSIVIDVSKLPLFSVTTNGNIVSVKVSENTLKNLEYDAVSKIIKLKKSNKEIIANDIVHNDKYSELKYSLTFRGNYEKDFGYGEYPVNDKNINKFTVTTDANGNTVLDILEKDIFATMISEDDEYVNIRLVSPKEKYNKIVIIDAGHGAHDPGTGAPDGTKEKDIVLDISRRAVELIERDGIIKVYATRLTDIYVVREDRANMGNKYADLFVSVHINASDNNPVPNGIESWFYPHDNDDVIGISGEKVASIMLKNLISDLQLTDRKVKSTNFEVLRKTNIPSTLLEIGFLSNPEDKSKLVTEEFRQQVAVAIVKGIYEVFDNYSPNR